MKDVPYEAPDFSLPDGSGQNKALANYKGNWLVLYFYPKDETPGCIMEACSLRDVRDDLTELDADVVGISKDEPSSHEKFKANHNLNFNLLSDLEASTIKAYGAWSEEGIKRQTFLIDPIGMVQKVYAKVTPLGHGKQVISDLKKLQSEVSQSN